MKDVSNERVFGVLHCYSGEGLRHFYNKTVFDVYAEMLSEGKAGKYFFGLFTKRGYIVLPPTEDNPAYLSIYSFRAIGKLFPKDYFIRKYEGLRVSGRGAVYRDRMPTKRPYK